MRNVIISTCFLLFFPCISSFNIKNAASPPNFVIMLMDDLGWGDLGCNGEPNLETPNIDRMAREGLTATNMYTSSPLCSPSRASVLTGRLPIRNGFYSNNTQGRNSYTPQEIVGGISSSEILLSELLHLKNYTNALIGKWHLGHQQQYLPLERGFDSFFGSTNCHFGPYDNVNTPNIPVFRDDQMVGRYFEEFAIDRNSGESNMTKYLSEEAVEFIESQKDSKDPFFLLWTPDSSHAYTYASKDYLGSSRRGKYGDAVRELDNGVGAILDALNNNGLSNNTLVIFTSDNGPGLVSKFDGGNPGPFLCGKQTTFEGGMRAPGIFWWPGTISPGGVTSQIWTHMDFLPTFLELADIPMIDNRTLDGFPLATLLTHPNLDFIRPVFFYRGDRLMAVRMGAYKMHLWTWNTSPVGTKKDFLVYMKGYLKALKEKLSEDRPEAISKLPTIQKPLTDVLKNFKDLQFYTGESQNPDGMVALLDYKEIDGQERPVIYFPKYGLLEEKL